MAENQQTLFDELGLSGRRERQITQQFNQQREARMRRGSGASEAGKLVGGVFGAIGSLFGKNKDRTLREGFGAGFQNQQDLQVAAATGQSLDDVRARRASREAVSQIKVTPTGDPIADQLAFLEEIIKVGNKKGDFRLVANANRKAVQLRAQQQELRKAEIGNDAEQLDLDIAKETDSIGRTVILQGDSIDGPHSKAIQNEDGTWTVMRPDGSVKQNVQGLELTFVDPNAKAKQRDRFFETEDGALKNALVMNGMTGTALKKTRAHVEAMGEQAGIIADMTDSMLNMYDPDLALDLSAKALIGADRLSTLAGNASELLTRANEKKHKSWTITWGGKKVTESMQAKLATDNSILSSYLAEQGLDLTQILPPHIKADSREAQLFQSNVMQMAYLDARLQEPSNRGLSDTDIKNALTRIGINTADPIVFARRQQQILRRLSGKLDNLGVEFAPTSQVSKQTIQEFVYQPESVGRIRSSLARAGARIDLLLSGGGVQNLADLSPEDLDKAIAEAEAAQ